MIEEGWVRAAALASEGVSSNHIYDAFVRCITEKKLAGDALDFGAGRGGLVKVMKALGLFSSLSAIDLIDFPGTKYEPGVIWKFQDLNLQTPFEKSSFDVVCSSEVIEHLENPRFVVREWFRLLRPNGYLVFSTPNNESLRSLLHLVCRGHFVAFGEQSYPAHITALLRKDMQRILAEAGFGRPSFFYTKWGSLPGMPRWSWQDVSGNMLRGRFFSDNVIVVAQKM